MRSSPRLLLVAFAVLATMTLLGCGTQTIEEVDPDTLPAHPTYTQDIEPLMAYYCVGCHSPDHVQFGDFDYSTFEGTVRDYFGIQDTVLERDNMPPGAAQRLDAREKAIISRWANDGLPQ